MVPTRKRAKGSSLARKKVTGMQPLRMALKRRVVSCVAPGGHAQKTERAMSASVSCAHVDMRSQHTPASRTAAGKPSSAQGAFPAALPAALNLGQDAVQEPMHHGQLLGYAAPTALAFRPCCEPGSGLASQCSISS